MFRLILLTLDINIFIKYLWRNSRVQDKHKICTLYKNIKVKAYLLS